MPRKPPAGERRKFGRIHQPDRRDLRFAIRKATSSRKRKTWKDGTPSLDQATTPKCVGFGFSHWLLNDPIRQYIDPAGIYQFAKTLDGMGGGDGTSVRAGAQVLKALGFISEYRWAFDLDTLIYTLLEEGPVVVGTEWYSGMDAPTGPNWRLTPTGRYRGGHAYLLNAVDTVAQTFGMKQSWGVRWGNSGRAVISFADMEKLLRADGEACLAVERRPSAST